MTIGTGPAACSDLITKSFSSMKTPNVSLVRTLIFRPAPDRKRCRCQVDAADRIREAREIDRRRSAIEAVRLVLQLEHAGTQSGRPVEPVAGRHVDAAHQPSFLPYVPMLPYG